MAGMERFTQRARRVLSLAHQEAERLRYDTIETEHLLIGLILEENGVARHVLSELGLEAKRVQEVVELISGFGNYQSGKIELSAGVQKVLENALDEAKKMGHHYVGTEHLLLGLSQSTDGQAHEVLRKLGVTPEQIRRQTRRILQENTPSQAAPAGAPAPAAAQKQEKERGKTPLVDQLATDLTTKAEENKLDPVVGRQMEIERVIQILARRNKNNPALIGEPGVGKTAIVEGLAQRIVEGDVPALLLGKRVLQLDVGSLVAGTMYRGQFEERLKRVIDELKQSGAILFIDEVHMLVGAGSAGSSVDAANILKPALSRGELQVIGATTMEEYRKHIESDAALERRFQPIVVNEPTVEETIKILQGIRSKYEEHHRLQISDEALEAAARLSARYISDRFLPDKAIDLIDEASSRVRMYKSPAAQTSKELLRKSALCSRISSLPCKKTAMQMWKKCRNNSARWKPNWTRCAPVGIAQPVLRLPRMILPNWLPCGRVCPSCRWHRKNRCGCSIWKTNCVNPSSVKTKPLKPFPRQYGAPVPG